MSSEYENCNTRDDPWMCEPCLFHIPSDGAPTSSAIITGVESPYRHRFGGSPKHIGSTHVGGSKALHLLYNFDLADPKFPIAIPGTQTLPLYTAIRYGAGSVYYRMVSEAEILIVEQNGIEISPDFPYEDYPEYFPELPVALDDANPIYFDELNRQLWDAQAYPEGPTHDPTNRELVELAARIANPVVETCKNKECVGSNLYCLAVFHDEWLENRGIRVVGDNEYMVIVFYICYSCFTISSHVLSN